MRLRNCIGEFFLFRWLFGKFKKSPTKHDVHTEDLGTSIDRDSEDLYVSHDGDIVPIDDAATFVGDNLIDDSDNSENLDDLDIFMRDNKDNNYSYLYGDYGNDNLSRVHHSSYNDWNSRNYS